MSDMDVPDVVFGRFYAGACAGFAVSIWYFSCLFCSLGVGVISMNPGAVPGLWELSMIRTSLHFLSLP